MELSYLKQFNGTFLKFLAQKKLINFSNTVSEVTLDTLKKMILTKKCNFEIAPTKNIFSELISLNCFPKNITFISLIYSSSKSSEEHSKSSIIYVTNFS